MQLVPLLHAGVDGDDADVALVAKEDDGHHVEEVCPVPVAAAAVLWLLCRRACVVAPDLVEGGVVDGAAVVGVWVRVIVLVDDQADDVEDGEDAHGARHL